MIVLDTIELDTIDSKDIDFWKIPVSSIFFNFGFSEP